MPCHVRQSKPKHRIYKRKYYLLIRLRSRKLFQLFSLYFFFFSKEIPIENSRCQKVIPYALNALSFESPKKTKKPSNNPPPLTRGKRFLRSVEGSPRTTAYNLRGSVSDSSPETSSPVKSCRKRLQIDDSVVNSPKKRNRLFSKECDLIATPTRSSPRCIDSAYKCCAAERITCDNTHSKASCSSPKTFSELKYLESIGSIRTIRRSKHPGINKVPTMQTDTPTPFVSPESQNGWDRKTKLKLSYRIGAQCTDDIQFALIIYEPLTMVTRRNLLNEFQKAAEEDAALKASSISSTKSHSAKKDSNKNKFKNDKMSSLRRLRF